MGGPGSGRGKGYAGTGSKRFGRAYKIYKAKRQGMDKSVKSSRGERRYIAGRSWLKAH